MTVHLYEFDAPGSELHGEPFCITDSSRTRADERAAFHVADTFSLSTRKDARAVHRAAFPSRRAYREWDESGGPAPAESGISLTSQDADAVIATVLADDIRAAAYETFNAAARKAASR